LEAVGCAPWSVVELIAIFGYFLNYMLKKLPKAFRNFYVVTGGVFFIWILLLDSNNLINRFTLTSKFNSLEDEKEYYEEKIKEVEQDRDELFGDNESLEKFAREKYLMKKETEDIFVIQEK
jgi:hypothetical protein